MLFVLFIHKYIGSCFLGLSSFKSVAASLSAATQSYPLDSLGEEGAWSFGLNQPVIQRFDMLGCLLLPHTFGEHCAYSRTLSNAFNKIYKFYS